MKTPEIATDLGDMYGTNYLAFACFTVLIWDHIITFDQEVAYIWPARKNLLMTLFMINRYLTPLGFIVNLFAYLLPLWTPETCVRLVRYEGAMTVIGINIVALMMFMRIKALYHGNRTVIVLVAFLGLASFIMNAYLMTMAAPVAHHPDSGVHSCTMVFEGNIINIVSTSARLPLGYDTVVLVLTLYKTFPSLRNNTTSFVMRRLARDGFLYYGVILSVAMIWSMMILQARPGIQNIAAAPYLLLTVAMMSRITISLKSSVHEMRNVDLIRPVLPSSFTQQSHLRVARNFRVVIRQPDTTGNSLDFGVELPTMDLLRNQPNSGSAGYTESADKALMPNRPSYFNVQQSSTSMVLKPIQQKMFQQKPSPYTESATNVLEPNLPEMAQKKSSLYKEGKILRPSRPRLSTIQQESSYWDFSSDLESAGFSNRPRSTGSVKREGPRAI